MTEHPSKSRFRPPFLHLLLYSLVAGLLIGISALALYLLIDQLRIPDSGFSGSFQDTAVEDYDGVIDIDPPLDIPQFTLTNSENTPSSLSDFRGQFVLLTFGFTHCPDICPLTLNDFQRIRSQLGAKADILRSVFISVDGKRDTPETLREYFDFRQLNDIIALTGDEEHVRALGAPFGLAFEISDRNATGGYQVNHTAGSFLLDRQGRWIRRYQFGVPPGRIASDLITLLE